MWYIKNKRSGNKLNVKFSLRENAQERLTLMGKTFSEEYKLVHESGDRFVDRILTEGFEPGDLYKILLPRISIDEYVPANPQTDNIVVAFFIKGVPEAVVPFKNFCDYSNGVMDVDYGDSDTIMNTSVVYIEMDRENLEIQDLDSLLEQVCLIAELEKDDFTMTFPHTNKKFPYNIKLLDRYFKSRSRRKNMMSQKKAEKRAQAELDKQMQAGNQTMLQQQSEEVPMESVVNNLVNTFLEG